MPETLYVEVGKAYLRVPRKGDLLKIKPQESHRTYLGVCLSVNAAHRQGNERMPIVKALVEGRVVYVPLGIVEIQ